MPKALLVGDVHAVPEELEDCQKLIDFVKATVQAQDIDHVVFMGDLYNTHSVMRVEVLAFWRQAFKSIKELIHRDIYVLVGNHDYAGEGLAEHSLLAHEDQVVVVDKPTELFPSVMMLPYISGNQEFIDTCAALKEPTILCHQTFHGAQYENGMYAPEGVEPASIPQQYVISGHIHTPASFDKVTYVGAPRWRSLSDADVERAIWIYSFNDKGIPTGRQKFSTGDVCRQICYRLDTPEKPIEEELSSGRDWRIDIKGPADWIERRKAELAGPGIRIRTFCTDRKGPVLKESEGIDKAFDKFLGHYTPKFGSDKERLAQLARERLGV